MKNSRSIAAAAKDEDARSSGFFPKWTHFWFTPVQPVGLHTLRFLAGLLFTFWLLTLAGNQTSYFGLGGWVDRESTSRLTRAFFDADGRDLGASANLPEAYRSGWSVLYL